MSLALALALVERVLLLPWLKWSRKKAAAAAAAAALALRLVDQVVSFHEPTLVWSSVQARAEKLLFSEQRSSLSPWFEPRAPVVALVVLEVAMAALSDEFNFLKGEREKGRAKREKHSEYTDSITLFTSSGEESRNINLGLRSKVA